MQVRGSLYVPVKKGKAVTDDHERRVQSVRLGPLYRAMDMQSKFEGD